MTEIEQKALALVNEVRAEWGCNWAPRTKPFSHEAFKALCRAIEQHEAFRREVSEAVRDYIDHYRQEGWLGFDHFIIANPDPLVEAFSDIGTIDPNGAAKDFRAALAARGLKLVKKEPSQ